MVVASTLTGTRARGLARFALIVLLLAAVPACNRLVPVMDVTSAPIVTGSGKEPTLEEVRTAMVRALTRKTWQVSEEGPGKMQGKIQVRNHSAEVTVDYSTRAYSITYLDSDALLYDSGNIHRNYNKWIKKLQQTINKEFLSL